jgi:hypothetical protein
MSQIKIIIIILFLGQLSHAQSYVPINNDSIYVPCQISESFTNSLKWGALAFAFSAFGAYTAIGDELSDGISQGIVVTFYPSLIGSATFLGAFTTDYILCSNRVKVRRRGKNNLGFIFGYANSLASSRQDGTDFGLSYKFKNKQWYLPNLTELNFGRTESTISLHGSKKKFQEKTFLINLEQLVHVKKALYTFYGVQVGYATGYYYKRLPESYKNKKISAQNAVYSLKTGIGFNLHKNMMFKFYYRYFLKNARSTSSGVKTTNDNPNHILGYSLTFYML